MPREQVSSRRQRQQEELSNIRQAWQNPDQEAIALAEKEQRGFKANARAIAIRQGISYDRAAAILASGARKASPAAKRKNPALKKVNGAAKGGKK